MVRKLNKKAKVISKQAPIKRNLQGPGSKKQWNDLKPHHHFYANDGQILKNLKEMPAALRKMSMDTFMHHVGLEHNHFANWIEDCMQAKKVAVDVRRATSKTAMLKTLGRHL